MPCNPIVIDIETIQDLSRLSEPTVTRLRSQWAKAAAPGTEPGDKGALAPWTGRVVAIGMHLVGQRRTRVAYDTNGQSPIASTPTRTFVGCDGEAGLLRELWAALRKTKANPIVTFNGRGFDLPFIAFRCLAAGVAIDRDLWGDRYKFGERCDLMEVLTDFGALWPSPGVAVVCEALGIPSPKAEGSSGGDVAAMWAAGESWRIAEYCAGDVEAEATVFRRCVELGRLPEWMLPASEPLLDRAGGVSP